MEMIPRRISCEEVDADTVEILSDNINNTNGHTDALPVKNDNACTNCTSKYEVVSYESSSTIEQQSYQQEKLPVFTSKQFSQKKTTDFESCDITNEGGGEYSNSYNYDVQVEGVRLKIFNNVGEKCLQTDTVLARDDIITLSYLDYLYETVQNNSDAFTVDEETCSSREDRDMEFTKSKDKDPGSISVDQESEVNMEIEDVEIEKIEDVEIENVAFVEDNELENEDSDDIENIASDENDDFLMADTYSDEDDDSVISSTLSDEYDYHDYFDEDSLNEYSDEYSFSDSSEGDSESSFEDDTDSSLPSDALNNDTKPCITEEGMQESDTKINSKETTGDVEKDHKPKSIAADSPKLLPVLPLIFSYLCFEDLFKAQQVCTVWEDATKDTYVWRHAPFLLEYHSVRKLAHTPYLHTVSGPVNSDVKFYKLLIYLAKYVRDLRKLDLVITNPVSPLPLVNLKKCIEKFENLEFLTIFNIEYSDLPEALKSSCTNLQAISLYCDYRLQNFPHICEVIGNGFAKLRKLFIRRAYHQIETSKTPLSDLLRRKLRYLTDLSLTSCDIDNDVLDLIFNSKNLKKLDIHINEWPEITFDLRNMENLKSLILKTYCSFGEILRKNLFKEIKFPQNLESLEVEFSPGYKPPHGIMSNVINSLPNLRVLNVKQCVDSDFDQQLEKICSLQNLHTVNLKDSEGYSAKGIEYILKCAELKRLEIADITFTESTYESLKGCKYLCDLAVLRCDFDPDKLLSTILSMKNLIHVRIQSCGRENKYGKLVRFHKNVIKYIRQECKKKANVKIHNTI